MCDPDTCTTNGLRRGTQFGVPAREELVTACVECRGGGAVQVRYCVPGRGENFKTFTSRHALARLQSLSIAFSLPIVYELFTKISRDVLEKKLKNLNVNYLMVSSKDAPIHSCINLNRIGLGLSYYKRQRASVTKYLPVIYVSVVN